MGTLTQSRLQKLLHYESETGLFVRLTKSAPCVKIGDVAGYVDPRGYVKISVDGRLYKAHRLAWLYMVGQWPNGEVDHRDANFCNNRWSNLREATRTQNIANGRIHRDNVSGFKGVVWHEQSKKWRARIYVEGKSVSLGLHDSPDAAHIAYVIAAQKYFGEFARAS